MMSNDERGADLTRNEGVVAKGESVCLPSWLWWGVGLFGLAYLASILSYGQNLWSREHYQFFPMALGGAGFLAWERWNELRVPPQPSLSWWVGLLIAASIVLLGAATVVWSPWLAMISGFILLVAVIWGLGGWPLFRAMIPALLMLATLIRPPMNLDVSLTLALRAFAVTASSYLLDLIRIPHFLSGNVVEIPGDRLLVEEACSGINSTLFVLAFSLFYGLYKKRWILHVVLIMAASLSFVLLGNFFRISGGAAIKYHYGVNVLTGWPHTTFGLVLWAAYIGLVISLDRLLYCVGSLIRPSAVPIAPENVAPVEAPSLKKLLLSLPLAPRWVYGVAGAFAIFGVVQAGMILTSHKQDLPSFTGEPKITLKAGAQFSTPASLAGWTLVGGEQNKTNFVGILELQAVHSKVWTYQLGRMTAVIALDYPYADFHDLTICYHKQGWVVGKTGVRVTGTQNDPFIEVNMTKKPLLNGFLLYGGFTEDGRWVDQGFNRLVQTRLGGKSTYQVQMLTTSYFLLSDAERLQLTQLFLEARETLSKQVFAQLETPVKPVVQGSKP